MLSKDKLQRISHLAKKAKNEGLSAREKEEQQDLREQYIKAFRKGFRDHLHTIKVVDPAGNDVTPRKLQQSKNNKNKNRLSH